MYKRMGILLSPATAVCMLQLARDPSSFLDGCYWSAGSGSFFVTRVRMLTRIAKPVIDGHVYICSSRYEIITYATTMLHATLISSCLE